jgi:hypothetical protein
LGLKLDPRGRDSSTFSSCNTVVGPFAQFPGAARGRRRERAPGGDYITGQVIGVNGGMYT